MVGLHRLLSPQWLTFACTIAMALGGADGAVLERRQDGMLLILLHRR